MRRGNVLKHSILLALSIFLGGGLSLGSVMAEGSTAASTGNGSHPKYSWQVLPLTPSLPAPSKSGHAPINGLKIWYAVYGKGSPVIMLHGGLANSSYFGHQVPVIDEHHEVIVMDSRGQGRSTTDGKQITYDLMTKDVVGLMDYLHIDKAAVIGWSDGAIIGIDLAMKHPERVSKLFAFAANPNPAGVDNQFVNDSPVWNEYIARTGKEYAKLSATPKGFSGLLNNIGKMWGTQPDFTAAELGAIKVPTWIVDGDHDRAIKRSSDDFLFHHIPGSEELILPGVSHFAFLQRPDEFNTAILQFLKWKPAM